MATRYAGKDTRAVPQAAMLLAALLLASMLMPRAAYAQAGTQDERIAALEARVAALEEALDGITRAQEAPPEPEVTAFALGEALALEDGRVLTIDEYDTGSHFRYSPAGGFSTLTLSAKSGYRLLCLFITVQNNAAYDLPTAQLLDATVHYGTGYVNRAQDSFFYLTSRGIYAGGLKTIGPGAAVSGCLLFAVPQDFDDTTERVAMRLSYGDTIYECVLRNSGMRLEPGEAEQF